MSTVEGATYLAWTSGWVTSSLLTFACSAYLYRWVLPLNPGWKRLLSAAPVFPIYIFIPWIFDPETQCIGVAVLYCSVTWLASFKLLSFCFDRGPAASPSAHKSLLLFHVSLALPLNLEDSERSDGRKGTGVSQTADSNSNGEVSEKGKVSHSRSSKSPEAHTWQKMLSRCAFKLVLICCLAQLYEHRGNGSLVLRDLLYSVQVYLFTSFVCEGVAAPCQILLGVEFNAHFDQPYLATSLEDFWAHRWNCTVSTLLRQSVYEPTLYGLRWCRGLSQGSNGSESTQLTDQKKPQPPSKSWDPLWARLTAILMSFLISGVMHELAIFYLSSQISGEMTSFFVLNGMATVLERLVKKICGPKRWPAWISTLATLGFIFWTSRYFFFAPIRRIGLDVKVIDNIVGILRM